MATISSSGEYITRPAIVKIKRLSTIRLDRNNYLVWKALRGYELLEYIERPVTVTDPALIQQDQMLLAWIFSAISASVVPQITSCRTSYDSWRTLENIFNTRSKSHIILLQNQLRTLRKDSLSVDDYFAKLSATAKELREAGVIILDDELCLITLNGLDASYDPFVTTQTARIDDLNFLALLRLVRAYKTRLNRHTEVSGIATANYVQTTASSTILCQICAKKGHNALACYNRHNEQRFPSTSKPRPRFNRGSRNSSSTANTVWYPDSGASDHVSGDPASIQTTDCDQSSKGVTIANGSSSQV